MGKQHLENHRLLTQYNIFGKFGNFYRGGEEKKYYSINSASVVEFKTLLESLDSRAKEN